DVQLQWSSSDPDGDEITYDLFVGKTFPLTRMVSDQAGPSYLPTQSYDFLSRYYWQVVARDSRGLTNENSPIWSFTTSAKTNLAPNVPIALNPANNATGVALRPVFSWKGGDPDGDSVVYDLYLDSVSPPAQLVASNLAEERWTPASDLSVGVHYYWHIVARDAGGKETGSQVYSFFAQTAQDSTPPKLISVVPAHGAVNIAQTDVVRIVFSEPVLKDTASSALSFSPPVTGNWTWEDDVTVRFMPSSPWRSGSYNQLTIASSTVRDIATNIMTTGSVYRFTIVTPVPVPSSHRSSGFPVQANVSETVKSEVPALISGSKSYALAVASPNSSTFGIKASAVVQPVVTDPASAFREFERYAAARTSSEQTVSISSLPEPQASPQVGVSENFYIPAYGSVATTTAYPNNVISATCLGLTDLTAIYVDDAISNPSTTLIAEVRKRFEEVIRPNIRDYFGQEPAQGPDGESRLTILLTDSMADGILGIFYGVDLAARNPSDIQQRESNGRKMLYVTYTEDNEATRYGTMAHEFQHMVNYWQKKLTGGNYEATWLNEGMSKFAEEICGYGIAQGDQNTALLIELSQDNFASLSVTGWTGLNSYGLSYLFVRFLAQENRYGTTYREVTRALISSALTGTANVAAITGEAFDITLAKWGMSLYLNRYQSTDGKDYGLAGLNLRGTYSGVTLPGFLPQTLTTSSVSVPLTANAIRCFERTSTGAASTNIEVIPTAGALKLWFFDQRQ
ncbi:MAG: fibronectin type III protein, partial [uncultured bacterium]